MPGARSSDSTSVLNGRAKALELSPGVRTADGFEQIGRSCLRQVAENEPALRRNDADAVHRTRVGLRRLRAAISLFKKLVDDPQTTEVKDELRWMSNQLGPARDYEVFLRDVRALRGNDAVEDAQLRKLESLLDELRERALARVRNNIDSERYRSGLERAAHWLRAGDWATSGRERQRRRRQRRLRRVARRVLSRRADKLIERLGRLDRLDARQRHRLRIAVKKLRYGVEFFAGLFPSSGRKRKRFTKDLKGLQESLGRLNDISVHRMLAPQLLEAAAEQGSTSEPAAFALGVVACQEAAQIDTLTRSAMADGARLAEHARFWA